MAIAGKKLRRSTSKSASRNLLTLRLVEWLEGEDPSGCAELDKTLLIKCGRDAKRSRRGDGRQYPGSSLPHKRSSGSLKNCGNSSATLCAKAFPLPAFRQPEPNSGPSLPEPFPHVALKSRQERTALWR